MYVCMYVCMCVLFMYVYFNEWRSNRVLVIGWLHATIR